MNFMKIYKYELLTYENYIYPWWGDAIRWLLTLSSTALIPLIAIYKLLTNKLELKDVSSKI